MTTNIWVVIRHRFGISTLVPQTSVISRETRGDVAKCLLSSQVTFLLEDICSWGINKGRNRVGTMFYEFHDNDCDKYVLPHLSRVVTRAKIMCAARNTQYCLQRTWHAVDAPCVQPLIHFTMPVHAKCRASIGKSLISCPCSTDFLWLVILACVSSWRFCSGAQISFACVQPPPSLKQRDILFEGRNSCKQAKTSSNWT